MRNRSLTEMFTFGLSQCALGLFLVGFCDVLANMPTYYLDDYCGLTLDMNLARVKSGRILLRRPEGSIRFLDCYMLIKAPSNKRLNFKFHSFDVPTVYGCHNNHVQIFEDTQFQLSLTDKLCNNNRIPNKAYVTSDETAAVLLKKESFLNDQIELVFTAFNFSPCLSGDFQCDNSHCIDSQLYCNGFDNCGDESDLCLLKQSSIIGLVVAVVIIAVLLAIFFIVYMYRRRQRIRREKESPAMYPGPIILDPYTGEKAISYISKSSKNDSLLRRRDHQLTSGYFKEPVGHILLQPSLLLDGSDLTLKSNRGHRNDSFVYTRSPSKSGAVLGSPVIRLPLERRLSPRSKSSDLKPPFFFDRDGYYSDSSASQKVTSGHQDIYAVPPKKMKKSNKQGKKSSVKYNNNTSLAKNLEIENDGGKKKKKSAMKKKDQSKADTNGKEAEVEMFEHRNGSINMGYEEMTDVKYIDGSPLVNGTTDLPGIYITPPIEQSTLNKQGLNPFIWTMKPDDKQLLSPNRISTNMRSNENTVALDSNEAKQAHEITKGYVSPNIPQDSSRVEDGNHHTSSPLPGIRQPEGRHGILSTDGTEESSAENDSEKTQTNVDLPQLPLDVDVDTNYIRDHSGQYVQSPTNIPMSPTRQMGLEARHPDGSPFILHKASSNQVQQQRQEHPVGDGDVMDHVISFRSYPSPVPAADPILFHRSDSRYSRADADEVFLHRSESRYKSPTRGRIHLERSDSNRKNAAVDKVQLHRSNSKHSA